MPWSCHWGARTWAPASVSALPAARAALQTLAERLTLGETDDIAEPAGAAAVVPLPLEQDLRFHVDEFLRRVAAHVDEPAARRDAGAVLAALLRAVGPEEFHDMASELPSDFDPLLDEALRNAPVLGEGEPQAAPPELTYDVFKRASRLTLTTRPLGTSREHPRRRRPGARSDRAMRKRTGPRAMRSDVVRSDCLLGMDRDACFSTTPALARAPTASRRTRAARPIPRIRVTVARRALIGDNGGGAGASYLQPGSPPRVRGSPKWGNTRLSPNQVIAEIRSPSSVSTISPYGRAIALSASGR